MPEKLRGCDERLVHCRVSVWQEDWTREGLESILQHYQKGEDRVILAIDPGPVQSAVVWYSQDVHRVLKFFKRSNDEIIEHLLALRNLPYAEWLVIEQIASMGMAVGAETFETCVWTGRFMEAFGADRCDRITRHAIKVNLCGSARAKDANVRQAIIDRFGGKEKAIGSKRAPGPLYGVSGDCWSALAVALTWCDLRATQAGRTA